MPGEFKSESGEGLGNTPLQIWQPEMSALESKFWPIPWGMLVGEILSDLISCKEVAG